MLNESQKRVLFHLGYEWWMFRTTHDLLTQLPTSDDPVRNALLESLAIHGRGLSFFFCCEKNMKTDWNVTDLQIDVALDREPSALKAWREGVNKRVAHLTSVRANPLQEWGVTEARRILQDRIEKVRQALAQDLPDDWIGDRPATTKLLGALGAPLPQPGLAGAVGITGPAAPAT